MQDRDQRNRYLTIFCFAAPGAAIVWFIFHAVYEDLSQSVRVVGYVDPMTQAGIALGYIVMIGGTLILAGIAVWAAIAYLRIALRRR